MSVRLRLTLWYLAVLCAGLALFAGAVVWQTEQSTGAALDATLRHRAQDVADDLRIGRQIVLRADAPDESGRQPGEATLWIRVLDPRGRIVVRQGPPLPGIPSGVLAETRPGFRAYTLRGDRHVRYFVLPIVRGREHAATVQTITTTDAVEAARHGLLAAMGLAGLLIVLVAALGGLFLADRALRPVDRITRLAAQIGAGDLHRRVSDEVWGRRPGAGGRPRDDELGRLARTFDAMVGRLEEAGERRRRLTADAAHELATPIATIATGAEIALRRPRRADEYRVALEHILEESRHMGHMVDDLLLLARADAGRLPLQHDLVEIDEVCRVALRTLGPQAEERHVSLGVDVPPRASLVMGDETRLGQVVRNLLDNALRYTPAGGAVTLTLRSDLPEGAATPDVLVRVADTGPGIAPAERERVFERFHRLPQVVAHGEGGRRDGGSGLGLAICKAIVVAHGGRIWVENSANHIGTCVVVALPGVAGAVLPEEIVGDVRDVNGKVKASERTISGRSLSPDDYRSAPVEGPGSAQVGAAGLDR